MRAKEIATQKAREDFAGKVKAEGARRSHNASPVFVSNAVFFYFCFYVCLYFC
jgi:hypothetical protein